MRRLIGAVLLVVLGAAAPAAVPRQQKPAPPQWAASVEPDFPFLSSVVDARAFGRPDNLSPRALVLNLGNGYWAAFDTDLLRIAAVWRGDGLSPTALAPGSYNRPDKKTPGGQDPLPQPQGAVSIVNGIYPGWQSGERPSFTDPREPAPSPEEVGRGPIDEKLGRFNAVRFGANAVTFEYLVAGVSVSESWGQARPTQVPDTGQARVTQVPGTGQARTTPVPDTGQAGATQVPDAGQAGATQVPDAGQARVRPGSGAGVVRRFAVGAASAPLIVVLGSAAKGISFALADTPAGAGVTLARYSPSGDELPASAADPQAIWVARIPAHQQPIDFSIAISNTDDSYAGSAPPLRRLDGRRWSAEVTTRITPSTSKDAFVVDDIGLPVDNPWRRNVRPSDVQFLSDGTAVVVTLDGDVWLVRGLHERAGVAHWRRFTSGLHEPLTVAIRDDQIYAFDRNGIWRLRDSDGDGEADAHQLFSNAFAQTADMREFPSTLRAAPNGEFVIAKGGQEAATIGKHNGSILRISADGRTATVLGYGFRQPNLSVNPKTGLVLSSDQQGHYIPSTPLHVVRDRQFYGFLSDKLPREVYPAPIAEPLTWIPHATNASAMSQVWLYGARMGPLTDALVHIGFNNPELFRVLLNERMPRLQAAVVSVTRAFDFPTLNGSVNPADGQLYLTGFQILGWGTTATKLAGMGRVRYTGAVFTGPREVTPMQTGILVRFDVPLDAATATNPDNFSITSWHYKRTFNYGSPQFKADGSNGIDRLPPSRAYLSNDHRAVFIAVPGMTPVMQMRVAWSLTTSAGLPFQESAYFTPYELARFDPRSEGFADVTVDLTPRAAAGDKAVPVSVEEGRRLTQLYGCAACHAVVANAPAGLGPSWKGLFGSERTYAKGVLRVTADEAYLRESILTPAAKVVTGYERGEAGMPSYAGVLTDPQIESILLYIKTLK